MSSKQLRQLRQQAYEEQNGRCFYCKYPMWVEDDQYFSRVHGLPPRFAKYLKCTAEHLLARQDLGRDTRSNVVAACAWCNKMRHQGRKHNSPNPSSYEAQVSSLVSRGRWHPLATSSKTQRFRENLSAS
jgi:hypothetical protein